MADPEGLNTLGNRVHAFIHKMHAGSVNSAAQLICVPTTTLQRIVAEESTNPRINVLQQIADYYGAPLGWLLTGRGPIPDVLNEKAINEAAWQWRALVRSMNLPPKVSEEILHLPDTRHDFHTFALMTPAWTTRLGRQEAVQSFVTAGNYIEWYETFAGLIQFLGMEEMRRVRARHPQLIRGRFTLPLLPEDLAQLETEQLEVLGAEDAALAKQYYQEAIVRRMGFATPPNVYAVFEERKTQLRKGSTKKWPTTKKPARRK